MAERKRRGGWLDAFSSALASGKIDRLFVVRRRVFLRISSSRNVKTMEGVTRSRPCRRPARGRKPNDLAHQRRADTIKRRDGGLIAFETKIAHGRGMRMKDGRAGRCTAIEEPKGFEERRGDRVLWAAHGVYRRDKTWLEAKRAEQKLSARRSSPIGVVGGGQGIVLGAR
jgi:hypothetical protein